MNQEREKKEKLHVAYLWIHEVRKKLAHSNCTQSLRYDNFHYELYMSTHCVCDLETNKNRYV